MKRILCFILAMLMLVSVVACGQVNDDTTTTDDTTEAVVTEAPVKIPAEAYDGVFQAGFSRKDITPKVPIKAKSSGTYNKVQDNLYLTCVAVYDGENYALFYTMDVTSLGASTCESFKKQASKATGVPIENIILSATHTHTAPTPGIPSTDVANIRWVTNINTAFAESAKEAIADLADAEIYNGTKTVKGMAFVRRGYAEDGSPRGIWRQTSTKEWVAYESEADNSVQIIRFVREDKKDIVMANLQTHFTEEGNYSDNAISADLATVLRSVVETKDEDALFAVYVGASGNINTNAYVDGTKKFGNYRKMGDAVAKAIIGATDSLTKVEAGKIQATGRTVAMNVRKEDAETLAKAQADLKEVADNYGSIYDGDARAYEVAAKYGFDSIKEASFIVSRNTNYGDTRDHYLGAISFGDLSFIAVPYEMFDTNGMEVKKGSPFNMTFVITNAGGAGAYVPSALAVPNGGYEVYSAVDEHGAAEKFVAEYLDMLKEHKGIN